MSYTYNFARNQDENGNWLINNSFYLDEYDNQIFISSVIKDLFPTNQCVVHCVESNASFIFENELSIEEQDTLSTAINNYQNYRPTK